jgi:hypothetical protein
MNRQNRIDMHVVANHQTVSDDNAARKAKRIMARQGKARQAITQLEYSIYSHKDTTNLHQQPTTIPRYPTGQHPYTTAAVLPPKKRQPIL